MNKASSAAMAFGFAVIGVWNIIGDALNIELDWRIGTAFLIAAAIWISRIR